MVRQEYYSLTSNVSVVIKKSTGNRNLICENDIFFGICLLDAAYKELNVYSRIKRSYTITFILIIIAGQLKCLSVYIDIYNKTSAIQSY